MTEDPRAPAIRALLIDDDPITGRLLRAVLGVEGIGVDTAQTGEAGLEAVAARMPDVVVLDLRLPDVTGMEVLRNLQARWPSLPVVVLTGRVEVRTAVEAMRLGAFHYLTKPMDRDELVLVLRRALERSALRSEVKELRRQAEAAPRLAELMGPSVAVGRVIEQVEQVADSGLTVLIVGETGTGKELVAQAIHQQSARRERPLIAVDCGAIPEPLLESELFGYEKGAFTGAEQTRKGQFQLADGGTLFLDEAGNLPAPLQPKLLRVLESREVAPVGGSRRRAVDVRIVAATNAALKAHVREGRFREDLYFRLTQFTIHLPPLRERLEDLPFLVRRFVREMCLELKRPIAEIAPRAIEELQAHRWPGNVRELRNVVRQGVVRCRGLVLESGLLAAVSDDDAAWVGTSGAASNAAPTPSSLREIGERAQQEAERAAIASAMRRHAGNKSAVARQLQTDYKTLLGKIRRYGIADRDTTAAEPPG